MEDCQPEGIENVYGKYYKFTKYERLSLVLVRILLNFMIITFFKPWSVYFAQYLSWNDAI